jgi:hypothetical protein
MGGWQASRKIERNRMRSLPAVVFRVLLFSQFLKKRGQIFSVRAVQLIFRAKIPVLAKPLAIINMALGRDRVPDQGLIKQAENFARQYTGMELSRKLDTNLLGSISHGA